MTGSLHVLFPGGKKPDRRPRDAADDIFAAWLTYSKSRADSTAGTKKNYARVIRNVSPWAGDTPFLDLHLHAYVDLRRDAGTAPRTIELELCIIRMVFRWAKEEGLIQKTAHMRFPRLRIDRKKFKINHRTPTAGEVARVLAVMPDDDWKMALALLAKTGARVGEVSSTPARR